MYPEGKFMQKRVNKKQDITSDLICNLFTVSYLWPRKQLLGIEIGIALKLFPLQQVIRTPIQTGLDEKSLCVALYKI